MLNDKNLILHSVTGKIDNSFIGIKIKNNIIEFYYPESYQLADYKSNFKEFRKDILSILGTIKIAKTLSLNKAKIESSLSNNNFAILSYLWIIKDYLNNGFYVNREKEFKTNQRGKINWKRTMKNQPIISGNNLIYKDIVVEVRNSFDNIIVDIHKYCVKKSIDFIGWLFNLNSKSIDTKPFNNSIKNQYLHALRVEIDKSFDDYKKLRLNHMLKVLEGLDGENNNDEFVYGVDSYYYIFERMIDSIFGNQKNLKEFNPKANWYLAKDSFKKNPSSKLRPDTILINNEMNIAYIFDSKYYRFGITNETTDLPETTSIQKQITYGDYLKKNSNIKVKDIRNAFILPYNMYSNKFNTNDLIHYIGFSMAEWKENTENKYESIYAFLIDMKHVIQFWNKHNHEDDIDTLIKLIEDAVRTKENLETEGKI